MPRSLGIEAPSTLGTAQEIRCGHIALECSLPDADEDRHEMKPDEVESLTYSIGPLHRTASPLGVTVAVLTLVAIVVITMILFT
ncbi:MAG: hypothetical protein GY722_24005 [bacterium]|nr:hypothetical protein [bacterium]